MRYSVGDLLIDTGRQAVSRSGVAVALPKLSYDALLALVRAAPNLVTLDELMRQVWPGLVVSPETVSKRIMLLRDALDDDPRAPRYIGGLRGRGYQVVAVVAQAPEPDDAPPAATGGPVPPTVTGTIPSEVRPSNSGWRLIATLIAALVVMGAAVAAYRYSQSGWDKFSPPISGQPSIAVLPFTDMSAQKDQEYFADGMSEEILDLLVKIPGLKVIARSSSFQFKGQNIDLRTVGEKLGVSYIVEGSVRKSGDELRVTAQLIDSRDGSHLMSNTYERTVDNALTLQREIAAALVRTLQITVGVDGGAPRPTLRNFEAYSLYLHGRQAYNRLDQQGLEQASSDFQRALDIDPSLSSAMVFLALTDDALGEWGYLPPAVAFERARDEANHASALDPKSAYAHIVLAAVHEVYDWDWAAANRELEQARALAPSDAQTLLYSGRYLLITGRPGEALKLENAALERDPLDPIALIGVSWAQIRQNRLSEAADAARRAVEVSPTYAYGHYYLATALLLEGERDKAAAEFAKDSDESARLGGLALGSWALRRTSEADRALTEMIKDESTDNAFGIAEVYAYRAEQDEALKWLEKAYEQKDVALYYIKGDPLLRNMESDSRYKAFLRKMNLPE